MQVKVAKNIDQIDEAQWNALAHHNVLHTIYQTYQWNRAASRVYGSKDDAFILYVKDNDKLLAIFPLMFLQAGGKRVLQFMAGQRSDYCGILCPDRQEEILLLFWQYIFSKREEWDMLHLSNLPLESDTIRYFINHKEVKVLSHRSSQDEAVYLRFHGNEAHTQQVLHKKKILACRNYFQSKGKYEVLHLTKAEDIEPYLDGFFSQHIQRWQKIASPSLFTDERNRRFYRHIVADLPTGWITFSVLKWNGQVLGYHLGFSYEDRFIWYKPSYNVEFADYSPGQVLLQEVMEYAFAKGFEEFDFGVGRESYKYRFSDTMRRNNSFKVFSSRPAYLNYYVPLALGWRLRKMGEQLKSANFFVGFLKDRAGDR